MAADSQKIIVIDGSSYFFRAYYAIQRLSTSKGFPTNAIYGFINMLLKTLDVEKPSKLAIAFDTAKPSFRKELYKEYKANREAPPEDLVLQIPEILRSVDCFGIKRIELPGFEADDVIGTIVKQATKDGFEVDVITGDKDLMQLVTDRVAIYDSMKDKRYGIPEVKEKFGVLPTQVIDYLALMGDSSDNIPGVTGIGEKTAAELINAYGSLDGIYENIDKIKQEKRRETLKAEKEIAYLSQKLATVNSDVPIDFNWEEFSYRGPKEDKLRDFFEQFEFRGLMKRFNFEASTGAAGAASFDKKSYTTIGTESEWTSAVKKLKTAKALAVDTETTSLRIQEAEIVGVSLCGTAGESYYVPIHHRSADGEHLPGQMDEEVSRKLLRELLESDIPKVGQNLKYDKQILRRWGIELKNIQADTLLESYLIDPDKPHNLDSLAERFLDHKNISYEEVTGKGKSQISFAQVAIDKATEYSCEDADVALRLHEKLYPDLKDKKLISLFESVEIPLVSVLADMEYRGVLVDEKKLKKMGEALVEESAAIEDEIYKCAGETFNINSPKQLSVILFEKLKLPVIRRTKTGISTDEGVLEELKSKHKICASLLKFRGLMKLKSTYVDGLLSEINGETKRVHTNYNQTVAATGRLSSSNPNLQNIPSGGETGYDIRSVFIAKPGHLLVSADYSQVELRLLGDLSGDKELIRAFENDEDIHSYTGKLIFHKDSITAEERKIAKTINFGVVYGQTPYGLSQTLKISPHEAKEFIDAYFKRYSSVKSYYQEVIAQARKNGYVSTKLGRRRYLPELTSQNRMRREMSERAAINAPLQGSAADLIKVAMINLDRRLIDEKLKARMIMQVHDELVLEVPVDEKDRVIKVVKAEMEGAMKLKVPIKVDVGSGENWRECK